MAILLKTTSVWVSSIQIMQVRVQNKGKSVWKSRYDGDISHHHTGNRTDHLDQDHNHQLIEHKNASPPEAIPPLY